MQTLRAEWQPPEEFPGPMNPPELPPDQPEQPEPGPAEVPEPPGEVPPGPPPETDRGRRARPRITP